MKQANGEKSEGIPSVAKEYGKTIHESNSIFINESLTSCRKMLLGELMSIDVVIDGSTFGLLMERFC